MSGQAEVPPAARRDERERTADCGQHAEAEHVDLQEPELVEVVLVPLDHGALRHRRVLDRNQLVERAARDHEAAGVLRQVARKPDQLAREREHARDERVRRVEARVPDPRVLDLAAVPPLHRVRETVDLGRVEPQRLADVAHRALRPVADHSRRERGAGAAVLRVEVLDHLLAPLVLEVHVDVGRLVALARDEALEQHGHARRVHLGDAERVAGGGVRRRAPPLAQDAAGAGELDEVVHRQEIGLVAEFGDQRELALDELPDRRRHPCGPAPHRTLFDQAAQVKLGRRACRHDLLRVFVAELVEREPAALGYLPRRVEERLRVQRRDPRERAEHAFAVRV